MLFVKDLRVNKDILENILKLVKSDEISIESAIKKLNNEINKSEFELDVEREKRVGFGEVIYGKSKSVNQIIKIAKEYEKNNQNFLCTGLDRDKISDLKKSLPDFEFLPDAGMVKKTYHPVKSLKGKVAILTAGTSDAKVAYEASETLHFFGVKNRIIMDVGVAGIHRFFNKKDLINEHDVIIVIAGMEGALPSVVGGLFSQPVIAVPTSVGYGAALNGFTALMSMLTSCANGITVVNIDNGFGAAMAAFRILKKCN